MVREGFATMTGLTGPPEWVEALSELVRRAEEAEQERDRLREALGSLLKHSLLQVRAAAFGPKIGVRYTEAIRSSIEQEIRRMEDFIRAALDASREKELHTNSTDLPECGNAAETKDSE